MPIEKERVRYRRAHGLCVWCGEPIPKDFKSVRYCPKHFERVAEKNRDSKARLEKREKRVIRSGDWTGPIPSCYDAEVAAVCLSCKAARCMHEEDGCAEYKAALKKARIK